MAQCASLRELELREVASLDVNSCLARARWEQSSIYLALAEKSRLIIDWETTKEYVCITTDHDRTRPKA